MPRKKTTTPKQPKQSKKLKSLKDLPEQPRVPRRNKIKKYLRVNLTEPEKVEAGKELGEANNELVTLDADLKRVKSDFKAKIDAAQSRVGQLSGKVVSGYEFRDVECEVIFDDPKPGEKTVYRLDLNEKVETRDMTDEEKQLDLALPE